jgi:hypothetical protein
MGFIVFYLLIYFFIKQENSVPQPHIEAEVAEVPPINIIHYTSPLTSTDSASARTELSSSAAVAAPEEINSHRGAAISCGEACFDPKHFLFSDYMCPMPVLHI